MGKKTELDKKSAERLEKLEKEWKKGEPGFLSTSLSSGDLRLLLEHSEPVRALIRAIASDPPAQGESASTHPLAADEDAQTLAALREEVKALSEETKRLAQDYGQVIAERDEARRRLAECEKQSAHWKDQAQAAQDEQKKLAASVRDLQSALRKAQDETEVLRRELEGLRRRPALGQAGDMLAFLRSRADLTATLGLEGLSDNAEGLARMVAVLAQKDNVVRLLESLGKAAEKRNTPVAAEERALLEAAVAWLNHNWRSKPYRLVLPEAGGRFDYDAHKRASHTPKGERIAAVLAPGLQNGQERWECKPIVATE